MRRLLFAAMLFATALSTARSQKAVVDPIVGKWHGVGDLAPMIWVFKADHTDLAGLAEDKGRWERESAGNYRVYETADSKDPGIKAHLDEKGRLIIEMSAVPDRWLYLVPDGPEPGRKPFSVDPKGLLGKWKYCYSRNGVFLLAPGLETLEFTDSATVQGTSTLLALKLAGKYGVSGNRLNTQLGSISQLGETTFRLEDDGKTLILAPMKTLWGDTHDEFIFARPEQTLRNTLEGTWATKRNQNIDSKMQIAANGKATISNSVESGGKTIKNDTGQSQSLLLFWHSEFGDTITQLSFDPMVGFVSDLFVFERTGDSLKMTSIETGADGELHVGDEKSAQSWHRESAPAAAARP